MRHTAAMRQVKQPDGFTAPSDTPPPCPKCGSERNWKKNGKRKDGKGWIWSRICSDSRACRRKPPRSKKPHRGEYKALGLCRDCHRPTTNGQTQCDNCLDRTNRHRQAKKAKGICAGCTSPALDGQTLCSNCLASVRRHRQAALNELARGGTPECAGWPHGSCGTKKNLQIDHIHNDGHLDLLSSGRRRGGVSRVMADPTPWTWAQILCRSCNVQKARDVEKAGLKPVTKDDVERIRKQQGRKKQSPKIST